MEPETILNGASPKSLTSRMNKIISFGVSISLLAGTVTFSACDDDDDPAAEGRKAAQELCDCLEKAATEIAIETCFDNVDTKYGKYENNEAFEKAADAVLSVCDAYLDLDDDPGNGEDLESSPITGNTITASVENGNAYNGTISTMKAVYNINDFGKESDGFYYVDGGEVAGTGNYSNGGFTLQLNATIPDAQLSKVTDWAEEFGGATISNTDAKIVFVDFIVAYNSAGKGVDYFNLLKFEDNKEIYAMLWYADRDFSITGGSEKASISLQEGWNYVYVIDTKNSSGNYISSEMTTKPQSGLKWYSEEALDR
jgi:hypothetical protein